jgi:hypothetical protein
MGFSEPSSYWGTLIRRTLHLIPRCFGGQQGIPVAFTENPGCPAQCPAAAVLLLCSTRSEAIDARCRWQGHQGRVKRQKHVQAQEETNINKLCSEMFGHSYCHSKGSSPSWPAGIDPWKPPAGCYGLRHVWPNKWGDLLLNPTSKLSYIIYVQE